MKVGLIDVDGHNYPNLPLMKLSAWHKQQGDSGINRTNELIDAGIPKMYDGKSWVFRADRVADWYEDYLQKRFPIQEVKLKF